MSGWREGRTYAQTHYYILSRPFSDAGQVGRLIRAHWSIENRLHYVKDVTMGEDKNRIAHPQAAKNVSLLKNMALNLARQRGYTGLKRAIDLNAHNIKQLYQWLL
jgi:predicted transposase YbfD/YdcC